MRLYHYTTIPALYGIIQNKEWWFGSFQSANDKSELTNYISGLKKSLLKRLKNEEQKEKCCTFFEKVNPHNDLTYFLSLSTARDNVNLWDRYTNQSTGVCLVFNEKKLRNAFEDDFFIDKVYYRKNFQTHEHFKILEAYFTEKLFINGFSSEKQLISNIQATSCKYKHPSFKGESEIRLVAIFPDELTSTDKHFAEVQYKLIGNKIKQVLVLKLDTFLEKNNLTFEDLVQEIILAPKSEQEMHALQNHLRANGFYKLAEKITISECPLR